LNPEEVSWDFLSLPRTAPGATDSAAVPKAAFLRKRRRLDLEAVSFMGTILSLQSTGVESNPDSRMGNQAEGSGKEGSFPRRAGKEEGLLD
jgi:hypothetical protein